MGLINVKPQRGVLTKPLPKSALWVIAAVAIAIIVLLAKCSIDEGRNWSRYKECLPWAKQTEADFKNTSCRAMLQALVPARGKNGGLHFGLLIRVTALDDDAERCVRDWLAARSPPIPPSIDVYNCRGNEELYKIMSPFTKPTSDHDTADSTP